MSQLISFISRKGGTGKTTNAIQLASMLHSIGYKVAVVETDANYTLSTLRKLEASEDPEAYKDAFTIWPGEEKQLTDLLKKLKHEEAPHFIIVDSAGKTTDMEIRKLATKSDLILIPTSLSPNDLVVTYQTVEDLLGAKKKNKNLQLAILPSMLHSQTGQKRINENLAELKAMDCAVFENFVPRKKAFAEFSTLSPQSEFLPLTNELLRLLKKD